MMYRRIAASLLIAALTVAAPALAGSYRNLTPGESTKADADRLFGPPQREIIPLERYDYPPDNDDTRRISIRFEPGTGVIASIDVYPAESYNRGDFRSWFELGEPERTEYDGDGNLMEVYDSKGIALRFSGPDPGSPVTFFRHFAEKAAVPTPVPAVDRSPIPENARAYLGITVRNHPKQGVLVSQVVPKSAAERGGFQNGDVILEFENATFYGSADYRDLLELLAAAPLSRPVRFLVERGSDRIEIYTTLDLRTEESIANQLRLASRESFDQAAELVDQKKWGRAIPYLERAVIFNPRDTRAQELLGYCCLREKRYDRALAAYQSAANVAPDSPIYTYWAAVCYDRMGNREKAIQTYELYLQSGPNDRKIIRDASRRADYLRNAPEREAESAERFLEMIDAIRKEIQD